MLLGCVMSAISEGKALAFIQSPIKLKVLSESSAWQSIDSSGRAEDETLNWINFFWNVLKSAGKTRWKDLQKLFWNTKQS